MDHYLLYDRKVILVTFSSVLIKITIQPTSIFNYINIQESVSLKLSNNIGRLTSKIIEILPSGSRCDKYRPFWIIVFLSISISYYRGKCSSHIVVKWICPLIIMIVGL